MNRILRISRRRARPSAPKRSEPPFWITLLIYAVLFVVAELLRPKPELENAKPSGIGDFRFPTATEGRPVPLLWGRLRIEGPNVVWYGDLRQDAIKEKVKTGLFSSENVVVGYRYRLGVQSALCTGPLDELTRAWCGDSIVLDSLGTPITDGGTFTIDEPELFGGEDVGGSGGVTGTIQFFAGSSSQALSPYLSGSGATAIGVSSGGSSYSVGDVLTGTGGTFSSPVKARVTSVSSGVVTGVELLQSGQYTVKPATTATTVAPSGGTGCVLSLTFGNALQHEGGDTPAYHDIAYTIPFDEPTYLGNSTSIKPWKWEVGRYPNGLALTSDRHKVGSGDALGANPANVIFEILTSRDWGYGIDAGDIDTTNFSAVALTLFNEGNGFSFLLDSPEDLQDLLRRVEEHIDGVLFVNPFSGKYQIKLIRADYDILTVPELNPTNVLEVATFTRSSYEGTSNQVRVPFNDTEDEYKDTYGFAQDMANVRIVGQNVTVNVAHPGCKDRTLANAFAWRKLRTLAIPLSQGTFVVDRSLHGLLPGDPFGFTDPDIGFVRLPMRVKSIDYGDLLDGRITIEAVQDVFFAAAGVFDPTPPSGWQPPGDNLVAFPTPYQVAMEAPRMLTLRDPASSSPYVDKLFAAARKVGPEAIFEIWQRNAAGAPSGAFVRAGQVFDFQLIGQLSVALGFTTAATTTLTLIPEPDTQAAIENEFPDVTDLVELGTELVSLVYVQTAAGEGEFMLVTSAQNNGGNVQLNGVYRGVGDSVQRSHGALANVYLLFVGAGLSTDTIPAGNNVEVKLLPRSSVALLDIADATAIAFAMGNRTRRPYPPSLFSLNGTVLDTTNVDLDGSGAGENVGVLMDAIRRRDFRTSDEIAELAGDAAAIHADFPSANATTVEAEVRNGVTVLTTTTGISGTSTTLRQLDILEGLDTTTLPSSLTFAARQSHTFEGVVYKSRVWLEIVSTIVSDMIGKWAFGALSQNETSTSFVVVADTVDHVFSISSVFSVGDVEYRINAGAWTTLIAAGNTSGTIPNAAFVASDTIQIRHTSSDSNPQKLCRMTVSGTLEAYAVLT